MMLPAVASALPVPARSRLQLQLLSEVMEGLIPEL